jgi:iron complex outermembrane receptor protein
MNYSFQKAFFVGDTFAGNEVPLVPNHKLSAGVRYTFMDCLTFTYGMDFVGDRYFVNDLQNIQPKMKSYTVHQARVSYKKYGFELFFAVNNIFDTQYSEYGVLDTFTLSMPGYYPAPGRNYTCGLNFSF